jgi:hypothetical protein
VLRSCMGWKTLCCDRHDRYYDDVRLSLTTKQCHVTQPSHFGRVIGFVTSERARLHAPTLAAFDERVVVEKDQIITTSSQLDLLLLTLHKSTNQTCKHGRIYIRRYRALALFRRPFIQHQALPGLVVAMRKEASRTAMCVDAEHGQDVDR